jgi:uncharacterized protein YndB with AHSA1/START domain
MQIDTPGDRDIVVTRTFDAPRQQVFDAFTQPERVKRWLLGPPGWTMPVCEIDLRVGGSYRYAWASDDGKKPGFGIVGVFKEIKAPERIIHSERFEAMPQEPRAGDDSCHPQGGEVVVTTVFTEHDGRTTMTLTMHYPSAQVREQALKSGMERGMDISYDRLAGILTSVAA